MNKAIFLSLLLVSVGCSHGPATRAPSSTENCQIVADKTGKQFHVKVDGKHYGPKKWHSKHEAEMLITRYQQSGTCY